MDFLEYLYDFKVHLLFLVGFIIAFRLIFITWLKFDDLKLKRLEYVSLSFAALGIIALAADVRELLTSHQIKFEETQTINAFDSLKSHISDGKPSYICRTITRTINSPANPKDLQKEYDLVCKWYGKISGYLPSDVHPNFPDLNIADLPKVEVDDKGLLGSINTTLSYFKEYELRRQELEKIRVKYRKTDLEIGLFIFSPYLLIIALALGFTKVAGDIKLKT